ncbi:MAG: ComF family protein [Bacteroidetes bacterium]|nr:ComF family protein [Bacteroidota bacterium]
MPVLKEIKESVLNLFFPHVCAGCGSDLLDIQNSLCLKCIDNMPQTHFHLHADNPVEKHFWGRIAVSTATSQYYFTKESLMQHLMHQLKYKGNKELGLFLGRLIGSQLLQTDRFLGIDALVPLPLFPAKERKRGYNQATVLCEGISAEMNVPVWKDVVIRTEHTETQTKKSRVERWQNMEGKFELVNSEKLQNKHLLLVDDVVTTGATLEACGYELLKPDNTKLSIATLCYASH